MSDIESQRTFQWKENDNAGAKREIIVSDHETSNSLSIYHNVTQRVREIMRPHGLRNAIYNMVNVAFIQ